MDIFEVISRRVSVRNYQNESASVAELDQVLRAGQTAEPLTGAEMQFYLRSDEQLGREVKGIMGDYGRLIHAPHYIVVAARETEGYLIDAGFRFEQMILEATRRELGTCWIGDMFKEGSMRLALNLGNDWRVVALTPIGRTAEQGVIHRTVRIVVRSSKRKPVDQMFFWERHGMALPANILGHDKIGRILEATRWAPSWHNKQPWKFILMAKEVLVYKEARQMKEGKDYHLLDCGIAMAHLHLAAKALDMRGRWEIARFEIPGAPGAEPVGRYVFESNLIAES
jgi:nitroreductase